jgi:hypothetical protein
MVMNIVLDITRKQVMTSELLKHRPNLRTGFLSSLGLTSVRRFERYLQGNDREDLQRDAKVIARDMNVAIKYITNGRKK